MAYKDKAAKSPTAKSTKMHPAESPKIIEKPPLPIPVLIIIFGHGLLYLALAILGLCDELFSFGANQHRIIELVEYAGLYYTIGLFSLVFLLILFIEVDRFLTDPLYNITKRFKCQDNSEKEES